MVYLVDTVKSIYHNAAEITKDYFPRKLPIDAKIAIVSVIIAESIFVAWIKMRWPNSSCIHYDHHWHLQKCTNDVSKITLASGICPQGMIDVEVDQKPLTNELRECIELEAKQDAKLKIKAQERLKNEEWNHLLENINKIEYSKRDFFLEQMIKTCDVISIQDVALQKMSSNGKKKILNFLIDQRIGQKDCQSALEYAVKAVHKEIDVFDTIFKNCKEPYIQNKIIDIWNAAHKQDILHQYSSYVSVDGRLLLNGKEATEEEMYSIRMKVNEMTDKKIANL